MTQTRGQFVAALSLAGAAALARVPAARPAEECLETTTLRLLHKPMICGARQYVVEEMPNAEGFTDIRDTKIASSAEENDAGRAWSGRLRSALRSPMGVVSVYTPAPSLPA
jgi:hypothetical protein